MGCLRTSFPITDEHVGLTDEMTPDSGATFEDATDEDPGGKTENDATKVKVATWRSRSITIEPIIILNTIGSQLFDLTLKPLIYHKLCIHQFKANICENLHNESFSNEEDVIQTMSSHWLMYHQVGFYFPATFLTLMVYGTFSDKVSRRGAIIFPCVGQTLASVNVLIASVFIDSHVRYTLISSFLNGLGGGWVALYMALFSYLGDATSPNKLTMWIAISDGVWGITDALTSLFGGALLDHTSYVFVFSLSIAVNAVCVPYVLLFMKEPPRLTSSSPGDVSPGLLQKVWRDTKETLTCVFRKRPGNGRTHILLLMFSTASSMVVLSGKGSSLFSYYI